MTNGHSGYFTILNISAPKIEKRCGKNDEQTPTIQPEMSSCGIVWVIEYEEFLTRLALLLLF